MKGKVILVTGASRGIGRAIAIEFARKGGIIAINYAVNNTLANHVVGQIEKEGGQARAFQADIGQQHAIEDLFDRVINHFGGIDILINNAGVMENKPIAQVSEQEFDRVFNINVKGLFFCCQQAALKMRPHGKIINIGSSVTRVMLPYYGTYAATKGAVEQLTKVLAKELGEKQIAVNTVSPGPTDTELFRSGKTEEQINSLAALSAFNRLATPQDIAQAVVLACSDDASWISGQNILVNGGFVA